MKESDLPEEGAEVYRRTGDGTPQSLDDSERSVFAYASTRHMDRDSEVVMPDGVLLEPFRKAPHVLFNHKWSEPPIGSDSFIGSDGVGLAARSVFAATALGNDIWTLIKGKHLRTSSIGFIPVQVMTPNNNGWGELLDGLSARWPEFNRKQADNLQAIIVRSILLEHSYVSVPANPEALILEVSNKSLALSERVLKDLGIEVVIDDGSPTVLDEVPEPESAPVATTKSAPRLIARLIARPEPTPALSYKQIEKLVQTRLELLRGKI